MVVNNQRSNVRIVTSVLSYITLVCVVIVHVSHTFNIHRGLFMMLLANTSSYVENFEQLSSGFEATTGSGLVATVLPVQPCEWHCSKRLTTKISL
jgi:hypothetical protein